MAKQKTMIGASDKPRGGAARRVADMLPEIGGAAFRRFGFVQSSIVSRWNEIVGEKYAGVSAPESLRFPHGKRADGTLTMTVTGAHAPMMQHVLPVITERVNRFFGYPAVAKIVIRQGVIERVAVRKPRPELLPMPVELGESLRTIADPELKAVLESLARGVATSAAQMQPLGKIS